MKKSLSDLIEQSYEKSPDVDEESEAIGVLVASYNKSKGNYISRFIRTHEDQKETEKQYILRVMLKEIIIQYGDIFNTENIEQIIANSSNINFDVENFIIKSIGGQVEEESKNTESSKQTEQEQDFLETVFRAIEKFFKTIWNWIASAIKKFVRWMM